MIECGALAMDDRWADTGAWIGEEMRREAFFFASGGERMFGSLYAAPAAEDGVVICNSWGFEANQADAAAHSIALAAVEAGGAAMLFHYPGFGDSPGELGGSTMESLAAAATGALEEASRRLPEAGWTLAGLMLGGAVAALAARIAAVERLLLVQPELHPSRYFRRLERSSRRAAARVPARAGTAYGYPLPHRMLERLPETDATVAAALAGLDAEGAVVRHAEPPRSDLIPERFEDVAVPGTWRFGAKQKPDLARAASDWLRRTWEGATAEEPAAPPDSARQVG